LSERFAKAAPAPQNPTPLAAMRHRLHTPAGRRLYALRKQIPKPVFGIIKSVMGFRQFLLRGLDRVQGERSLVTMAWNMRRMYTLTATTTPVIAPAPSAASETLAPSVGATPSNNSSPQGSTPLPAHTKRQA
jgi:hypothetical protein